MKVKRHRHAKEGPARARDALPETERRPLRVLSRIALVLIVALVAGSIAAILAGIGLRADLEEGRRALVAGRRALLEGRIAAASDSFERAHDVFRRAGIEASSGVSRVGRWVPIVGRSLDVVDALTDAGQHASAAGLAVSSAIDRLPGKIGALAPSDGAFPIDAIAALRGPLNDAYIEATSAIRAIRSSPDSLLVEPVADARRQALRRFSELEELLDPARLLAAGLPSFLGADGPRRYLLFAENPAEPRGTGGLWGAFAVVRVEAGRFEISRFRPVQTLGDVPLERISAPNPDYLRNYDQWLGPGRWVNLNMTPDFPSAARAAMAAWEATGRRPVDGVLTADPFALRDLLDVTGPITLARPRFLVTRRNVVALLSNQAFALFSDSATRKTVLGDVARAVFDRFIGLDGRVVARLRTIGRAVGGHHLKVYAVDTAMQRALVEAELDGGLGSIRGDLLGVVVNAGAGGKVDFFAHRSIDHSVQLFPGFASSAVTTTTIRNDAPTSGQPRYVIGPHLGRAGDNIPLVAQFCGSRCELARAERRGKRISVSTGTELGYRYYRDYFTIPSGGSATLTLWTETRRSWTGDVLGGSYTLTILGQPTINPTDVTVRIRPPEGMRFTTWSDGIRMDGGIAAWSGSPERRIELEVSFEAPALPVRLWRAVAELF